MWMPWKNLCARGPNQAPRPARRVVPRLLPLEDRLAPATFAVTTRFDVVDPADGKVPALTEEARQRNAARAAELRGQGQYDHPELRPLGEPLRVSFTVDVPARGQPAPVAVMGHDHPP